MKLSFLRRRHDGGKRQPIPCDTHSTMSSLTAELTVRTRVLLNSTMLEQYLRQDNGERLQRHKNGVPRDCWDNIEYFIRYWDLNDKQAQAFRQFRDQIEDVGHHPQNTPNFAVRYLRTQDYNVTKAEAMFRKMLIWRRENGADTILQDYTPPHEFITLAPEAVLKDWDHEGDPVYLTHFGELDLPGYLRKYGHDECFRYEIYKREFLLNGEWIRDWEAQSQRPIKHIVIIQDMHGFSRRFITTKVVKLFQQVMRFDQDNYPDATKKILVIRAPAIIGIAWGIAKHFFDRHVVEKMEFTGESNWKEVVSKYMDLAILPPSLCQEGRGGPLEGLPYDFDGGLVPLD